MPRAVIFGVGGQTGHYVAALLRRRGMAVVGVDRHSSERPADVADFAAVYDIIRAADPQLVLHLAAQSTTRHEALFENQQTIVGGTWNVLEAVRRAAPAARVFIAGSGVQFANQGQPIDENTPFAPSSPYAVARISSVYAARYYRTLKINAYVGYLFHHESPLRPARHVSQMVARAAAAIAAGKEQFLKIGDLSVAKEWTFAGDMAQAIVTLLDQSELFEAVLGSGEAYTIAEWTAACFAAVGIDWKTHVCSVPGFVAEYRRLVSNPARMFSLGWRAQMAMPELAQLMVRSAAENL